MAAVPRLVRALAAIVAAALVTALAASAFAAPRARAQQRPVSALSGLERGVLAQINAFRVSHHLVRLRLSAQLTAAARAHSRQMASDGYFAHSSADGDLFWKRIERDYGSTGWAYWSVGENLLWSSPDVGAKQALDLWLASPEHRANLLAARWREIGVAAVHAAAAPGAFHGLDVTIVTTDFGVRR
jgi:uncharacterized protein YkwD